MRSYHTGLDRARSKMTAERATGAARHEADPVQNREDRIPSYLPLRGTHPTGLISAVLFVRALRDTIGPHVDPKHRAAHVENAKSISVIGLRETGA